MRKHTPIHDVWQRNYYEHIIRHDGKLNRTREYIMNNPAKWELNRENPNSPNTYCRGEKFFAPTRPEKTRP